MTLDELRDVVARGLVETVVVAITHVLGELPQHSVALHFVWSPDVYAECSEEWEHAWDCDGFCEFSDLPPNPSGPDAPPRSDS